MKEDSENSQLSEETEEILSEKLALAMQIAKEAVSELEIPEFSYDDERLLSLRWMVFYKEEGNDITLSIQLNSLSVGTMFQTSLGLIVFHILSELNRLFASKKAMKLLGVEESERGLTIYDKTLSLTKLYINYLPLVIFHSFHQALSETIISYIKKSLEYDLREHWEELDLPKNFSLVPDNNFSKILELFPDTNLPVLQTLDEVNEEFSAYRKSAFSNRKALFNQEVFSQLPVLYKELRLLYKEAKKEYVTEKEAFDRVSRRRGGDNWETYWEEVCEEKFPSLFFTSEIQFYPASQLAYRQLADLYGFDEEYMQKLVRNAKKQL